MRSSMPDTSNNRDRIEHMTPDRGVGSVESTD
jgi:hypothetical protein